MRNPDGSIKDQPKQPDPPPADPKEPPKVEDKKPAGPPEKYEFKDADPKLVEKVAPVFKELGLTQEGAEKLVGVWNEQVQALSDHLTAEVDRQQTEWQNAVFTDATLGNGKDDVKPEVRQNINAVFTAIGDQKLVGAFKEAMDLTGVGNHPAFVRLMNQVGKLLCESKPIQGNPPPGDGKQPGGGPGAAAMYPGLKSGT